MEKAKRFLILARAFSDLTNKNFDVRINRIAHLCIASACNSTMVCFAYGMNIKEQVCSLELAQRLKGLGIKQDSLFWYQVGGRGVSGGVAITYGEWEIAVEEKYSAFTVAELGEMLPANLWNGKGDKVRWLSIDENEDGEWNIEYAYECRGVYDESVQTAPTEADARAKMLIYLLENKLI